MFSLLGRRERQGSRAYDMTKATTDLYFLQRMKLDGKLCVHNGCVNTICWNEKGTLILSGSDDQHLAITDPFSGKNIIKFRSGHRSNIFSAKFMPFSSDKEVVSCSGSGEIFYTDIEREDTFGTNRFDCHFGSTYKLLVVPNEAATFLSCGDDGTVRFFDLRMKTSCSKFSCEEDVLIHLRNAVTSMAVDPVIAYQLAIASSDGIVRLYDRRMLKSQDIHAMHESLIFKFPPPMAAVSQGGSNGGRQRCYRVTSLNYRPGSHDLLVNYSSENIYLFNTYDIRQQMNYSASQGAPKQRPTSKMISTRSGGAASTSDLHAASTSKEVYAPVASTPPSDTGSDSDSSSFKPIKRLRLRGDWSDTGPDARPEGEEPAQNVMQRMSDLLTRMLNSHGDRDETAGPDQEDGNNLREEPSGDQVQASRSPGQQEPEPVGHHRPVGSEEAAAAMLRSVMFGSARSRATASRAERDVTRSSISSEGMVSHDLSPQGLELPAEPAVDTNFQTSWTNDSIGASLETSGQRQEFPANAQTPDQASLMSSGEGQGSDMLAQSSRREEQASRSDQVRLKENRTVAQPHCQSVTECESESVAHEDTCGGYHGCDSEQTGVLYEASSSSSEETQNTVISVTGVFENSVKNVSSTVGHSEDISLSGLQEMDMDEEQAQEELSSRKDVFEGTDFTSDKVKLNSSDISSDSESNTTASYKVTASLKITPMASCSAEGSLSVPRADVSSSSVIRYALPETSKCQKFSQPSSQDTEKLKESLEPDHSVKHVDPFVATETVSSQVPSDPSNSVPSSDTFSVASLWSSSSSATTVALAEDGWNSYKGNNSQETLHSVSNLSSLPTLASSATEQMSSNEQDFWWHTQEGHSSEAQRQPISACGTDLIASSERISYCDSEVLDPAEEARGSIKQDYQVKMSSVPHKPCEPCEKTQSAGEKGKGNAKSSNKQDQNIESHSAPRSDRFTSYNSGKMRVSSDAPSDSDEAGTSGMASLSGVRTSPGSNSSERRRRHGHSLPPTGNFQLYGSDDDDEDDNDGGGGASHRHARSSVGGTRQDKERMSKAAQKIQEVFRQRREAREMARIKEAPQPRVFMKFSGHRNCRTVIKEANFYGDNYVMSGSDCGRIMFWERETGQLVMYLDADKHVVNCVQPNPYLPVLASSGIDYDVKIWCPLEEDCQFDNVKSAEIISRNERMLEVTRDTVTVPAAFMLRILASLSQIRNGRGSSRQQRQAPESPSSNQD